MKTLLLFFAKFILAASLFSVMWVKLVPQIPVQPDLASQYNRLLSAEMTAIFSIFYPYIKFEADGRNIEIQHYLVIPGKVGVKPIFGYSLTMNTVPLVALFLATPGLAFKRRMIFLAIAATLLHISHLMHMYLAFLSTQELVIPGDASAITRLAMALGINFLFSFFTFWQQMGSMVFPFFLWLVFAYPSFPRDKRGRKKPQPLRSASGAVSTSAEPGK